jgi:hypothetical protein
MIYQYHHIIPYSEDPHFRIEDMMILCPNCHSMATDGALTIDEQRDIQNDPYNIGRGYSSGAIKINQPYCAVVAGGSLLVGEGPLIKVDGEPLLAFYVGDGGEMQLSIDLMDQHNNTLAVIERNEWVTGDPAVWDVESGHQRLVIRQAQRRISLCIDAKNEPVRMKAHLWRQGWHIVLNQAGIMTDNGGIVGGFVNVGLAGLSLCLDSNNRDAVNIKAYKGDGSIISEEDPIRRLIKSIEAYKKL